MSRGKLVRDRIPEIIAAHGGTVHVRVLDDVEYAQRLDEKLAEEVAEYLESGEVEELVDLVEVIQAILAHRQISEEEFTRRCEAKRTARGGFEQRQYLEP